VMRNKLVDIGGVGPSEPTSDYYTKVQSAALFQILVSTVQATLTDDQANYIVLGSATTYNKIYISGTIENGTNKQDFDGYVFTGNGTTATAFIDSTDHPAALTTIAYTADVSAGNLRLITTLSSVTGTIKVNYMIDKLIATAT